MLIYDWFIDGTGADGNGRRAPAFPLRRPCPANSTGASATCRAASVSMETMRASGM
ncbi:hypothetical protein JCM4914_43780 [Streptomyces platensis subsp. malvinus]